MLEGPHAADWKIWLTGQPEVIGPHARQVDFSTNKVLALFAYLILRPKPQPRHRLAGLLWGGSSRKNAHRSLRVALADLNRKVPHLIQADRKSVAFVASEGTFVDVRAIRRLLDGDVAPAPAKLAQGVELSRGDLLQGLEVGAGAEFEEWRLLEQEELRQQMIGALHRLADAHLRKGEPGEAVAHLRKLIAINPLEETAQRKLMKALALKGNATAALSQYEDFCMHLDSSLAVEPSWLTQEMRARIAAARQRPGSLLPESPTSFHGRQRVMTDLVEADHRLITITGPAGVGKSRLALEAARQLKKRYLGGVVYIPLAQLSDPDHLAGRIGNELVGAGFAAPDGGEVEGEKHLREMLAKREVLLILDGFDHLLSRVDLLARILRDLPGVDLWVTSCRRLDLRWEIPFVLEGLDYPTGLEPIEDWREYPAVHLLLESIRRSHPDIEIGKRSLERVGAISRQVEGHPLALELAAAAFNPEDRGSLVPPAEKNLRTWGEAPADLPERQSSLAARLDRTWSLLGVDLRRALHNLCTFTRSFTPREALAMPAVDGPILQELVAHSLLRNVPQADRVHFDMHPIVRQYVAERAARPQEPTGG